MHHWTPYGPMTFAIYSGTHHTYLTLPMLRQHVSMDVEHFVAPSLLSTANHLRAVFNPFSCAAAFLDPGLDETSWRIHALEWTRSGLINTYSRVQVRVFLGCETCCNGFKEREQILRVG